MVLPTHLFTMTFSGAKDGGSPSVLTVDTAAAALIFDEILVFEAQELTLNEVTGRRYVSLLAYWLNTPTIGANLWLPSSFGFPLSSSCINERPLNSLQHPQLIRLRLLPRQKQQPAPPPPLLRPAPAAASPPTRWRSVGRCLFLPLFLAPPLPVFPCCRDSAILYYTNCE